MYQLIGSPYTVAERFVAADLWHSVRVCAWIIYGVCNDSVYVRVCVSNYAPVAMFLECYQLCTLADGHQWWSSLPHGTVLLYQW